MDNYNQLQAFLQLESEENTNTRKTPAFEDLLHIPHGLRGFVNTRTVCRHDDRTKKDIISFHGHLKLDDQDCICNHCHEKMYKNGMFYEVKLKHFSVFNQLTEIVFPRLQLICSNKDCRKSKMQTIPFKAEKHYITTELENYIRMLLSTSSFTLKHIAQLTGVSRNIVKDIDVVRLRHLYTVNGEGKELKKPVKYSRYLGVDEFKLHNGYVFATHIIDLETGQVLWIAHGKKKQVIYDFMEHVGEDWMNHVEAVACDMNSDFQEAFEEKYDHITVVFDYFHIVHNLNDKLISAIRKDEQKRLISEGNLKAARMFKKSKYILIASKETRKKKDQEANEGKVRRKGSELFNLPEKKAKGGYQRKYDELIKENDLIFTAELVKDMLEEAYKSNNEDEMSELITDIIELCDETDNKHFKWFKKLLWNHFEGIIAHATLKLSSGKIEGINTRIKSIRRMGYGYPDDEYFFLKIIDMSRRNSL